MNRYRLIYGFGIVIMMAVIFLFSCQDYDSTMKTSDVIVKPIENTIKNTEEKKFESEEEEEKYWKKIEDKLDLAVRKSAHMINYGLLCLFVYLFAKSFGISDADAIVLALFACGVYGGSDELHQKFSSGRDAKFLDVCVDMFGAVVAMVLVRMGVWLRKRK